MPKLVGDKGVRIELICGFGHHVGVGADRTYL